VAAPEEFEAALAACRREALAAFGDSRVLLERYIQDPRHIEVQVFADRQGGCVWLGDRDCSAQRRHQKVIEEAPAPGLTPAQREQMGRASVSAAHAVGYVGAGTVEFLFTPGGEHFFMEMNTRLQVEHPVTEMATGLDLVEWQLRIAAGEPLPLHQDQVRLHGHSIEARIYAEDPDRGFVPATGRIRHLAMPEHVAFSINSAVAADPAAVRIDAAVRSGDLVTAHYDAMIAKLITWGADRTQALARLREALAQTILVGVANNIDFLLRLVDSAAFAQARVDTGLIGREMARLTDAGDPFEPTVVAAALARLLADEVAAQTSDPWSDRQGWRLNGVCTRRVKLRSREATREVMVEYRPQGWVVVAADWRAPLAIDALHGSRIRLRLGDQAMAVDVVRVADALHVFAAGRRHTLTRVDPVAAVGTPEEDEDQLCAPMPGKIIAVHVASGDRVERGQLLLVMEAMKMEHSILAPHDGTIDAVRYRVGDQVEEGATLVSLKESGSPLPPEGEQAIQASSVPPAGEGRG
jgi:3-methylcrotonyl-CoA carboxylase alpha subunit